MTLNRGAKQRLLRLRAPAGLSVLCLFLASCGSNQFARKVDPKYGVPSSPRVVADGQPVPKGGGAYRVGKPYVVGGRSYVPEENPNYRVEGLASWYGSNFHGRLTANGEVFDKEAISAAHPTLPMPSYVRVTNLQNKKSLIVRVNDRGPFHSNRVIDVSHKAAHLLGFRDHGVQRVKVEYVGRAALEGSDDRRLIATLREGTPAPAPVQVASSQPNLAFAQASRAASREVPVPAARPYSLGQPAPLAATEMTSVARLRPPAAPEPTGRPIAVVSGRGLY
jgi:rare lipoprotein A